MVRKIALTGFFILVWNVFPAFTQIKNINLVVSLTGSVLNKQTHLPVTTQLEAYDEAGKRVYIGKSNGSQKGYYFITGLKPGKKYFIQVNDMDYFKQKILVEIPETDKYVEYSKDLVAVPKSIGTDFYIDPPPFEQRKSKLRFNAASILEDFTNLLYLNPKIGIQVVCYPDHDLGSTENMKLTEERCNSIKNFLIAVGIKAERISTLPKGEVDKRNPPPPVKKAKGKNYVGPTYFIVEKT